jgi:A/G-specific adenine glycosylase
MMGEIASAVVAWYRRGARDLPWRRTRDPYAIWVSEVMLQQTRVETVIPYYERFLARFPDVGALAAAEREEVLALWQGLGYYRRARQLHLAAREVMTEHDGALPASAAELSELSGVGRYTAGAIASIAYGERAPLVDGNVARVLARLFGVEEDVTRSAGQRRLWTLAEALVPQDAPGDHNQGLMELGARVCLPGTRARCEACPLADRCVARRRGSVAELPRSGPTRAPRAVALRAAVVRAPRGRFLLAQRGEEGLFAGLWEPPMTEGRGRPDGVAPSVALTEIGAVRHDLTHRRFEVTVLGGLASRAHRLPRARAPYAALAWREPAEVPLSTLARRVLRAAEEGR